MLGQTGVHDPSTITKEGTDYFYYYTGTGIQARESTDGTTWTNNPQIFATAPAWTTTAVPGAGNDFWAPDVTFLNGKYYMYYSVSTFGSQVSAIGLATNPTLNPSDANYAWTDSGSPVIQSNSTTGYNTIDPSILQDSVSGNVYLSFGSFFQGVYQVQLDPTTGKIKSGATPARLADNFANNSNNFFNGIEASYQLQHDGFYYLFYNWGACCAGVTSTYNIRVARSTSPNGPFLDQNNVNVANGSASNPGGTLFLATNGNQIGPGQFSFFNNNGVQEFGYHYYDGNQNGASIEGLRDLYWTAGDWPSIAPVNPNWTGTTSGNWSTATNWSDVPPGAVGSIANFPTSTAHQSITLDVAGITATTLNFTSSSSYTIGSTTGNGLILDSGNTNNVTINDILGNHSVLAPITAKESLAVAVTVSTSGLTLGAVSGSQLLKYGAGTLFLTGINSYTSNVIVHQGALNITGTGAVTAGSFSSIGEIAGDVGAMTVSGSASFTTNFDLNIGDSGSFEHHRNGHAKLSPAAAKSPSTRAAVSMSGPVSLPMKRQPAR